MFLLYALVVIVSLLGLLAAVIYAEHHLYEFSRRRTLASLERLKQRLDDLCKFVPADQRTNPLMARVAVPLKRLQDARAVLDARQEQLQHDNDLRRGPHTRSEWRRLRKDVNAVLRRSRLVLRYFGKRAERDGAWPFIEDHTGVFKSENYTHMPKQPNPFDGAVRRVWGRGALDEEVLPSAAERRATFAQSASAAIAGPVVTLSAPSRSQSPDRTAGGGSADVIAFRRSRRQK